VPAHLAARAYGRDRYSAVLAAVGALPAPPPTPSRAGDVLAVVGDGVAATELAAELSRTLYLAPEAVLVASPVPAGAEVPPARRILGADDAARRAARLRAGSVPQIVVVAAPVDGAGAGWAREVLDALRPSAVWAVVDATRKPADTARHLAGLGRVDALAVHGAAVTADPGTVLGLDRPVAYLDGRPATVQAWAALLCARLAGWAA